MKAREKWGLLVLNNKDYRNFRMLKLSKIEKFCILHHYNSYLEAVRRRKNRYFSRAFKGALF